MNNSMKKMTEKEYVPLAVEVQVSDFQRSLKFYKDILGFKLIRNHEKAKFASFEFHGAVLMVKEVKNLPALRGVGAVLRFVIPNVAAYFEQIRSKAKVIKPLKRKDYGATRFYIKDPDGYQIKFTGK